MNGSLGREFLPVVDAMAEFGKHYNALLREEFKDEIAKGEVEVSDVDWAE